MFRITRADSFAFIPVTPAWTRANLQDPGVTTLAVLTYALTDTARGREPPIPDVVDFALCDWRDG